MMYPDLVDSDPNWEISPLSDFVNLCQNVDILFLFN